MLLDKETDSSVYHAFLPKVCEMDYSITGSVVVESPVEKAKDLPSLTAD